ncbi:hypothetical protein AgCh_001998 [Apium graveolens]
MNEREGESALVHHIRKVLEEDIDPIAICQWSVSTSPGLINLDASADSGSDIDSSDESNKDGDLRTPIAPPVTSLRMAKVILLAGTAGFWSYERSDTLVRMSVHTSGEKSETLVRKNEDKANTKNQKIRRKPEANGDGVTSWAKPQPNTVKVSVDAAIFEDRSEAGFEMVARDSDGRLIEAKVLTESRCTSPVLAEAIAVKEALSWIDQNKWSSVTLESELFGYGSSHQSSSMRLMTIAGGTMTGVASAFYLGYRKNLEEVEIERQLLLSIELNKLAVKVDEFKEKVDNVHDLVKQVGDLFEKKGGD